VVEEGCESLVTGTQGRIKSSLEFSSLRGLEDLCHVSISPRLSITQATPGCVSDE